MRKTRFSLSDRLFSVILSFLLLVGVVSISVNANTDETQNGVFTVTVVDGKDNPVDEAEVEYYLLTDNGKISSTVEGMTENGVFTIDNISRAEGYLEEGKNVYIQYEVRKEDYKTVSDKVKIVSLIDNIVVKLNLEHEASYTVKCETVGDGEVRINGNKNDSETVAYGKNARIIAEPKAGCFVSEFTLNEETEKFTPDKYNDKTSAFEFSVKVLDNVECSIKFEKYHSVSVSVNDTEGGYASLGERTEGLFSEGDYAFSVAAYDGYRIKSYTINGELTELGKKDSYSDTLKVDKDIKISVEFVKVYTLKVNYDSETGTVYTEPDAVGGSVEAEADSNVNITATPYENYRVVSVDVNGKNYIKFNKNEYTHENPFEFSLKASKDYEVEIAFALCTYDVNVSVTGNGKAKASAKSVSYGDSASVSVIPTSGYYVKELKVNSRDMKDKLYRADESSDTLKIDIESVSADCRVEVIFAKSANASTADVSFNRDEAKISKGNDYYVLSDSQTFDVTTSREGLKITAENGDVFGGVNQKTVKIDSQKSKHVKIVKIEVYYDMAWHIVTDGEDNYTASVYFDVYSPVTTLKADKANIYDYYNGDVEVSFDVKDEGESSGLKSVCYRIICDDVASEPISVFRHNEGDEIVFSYEGKITVDSSKYNSDNVQVEVIATDRCDNELPADVQLKINSTKPLVEVEISGERQKYSKNGYYADNRKAKVTITDRDSTFDAVAATRGIKVKAFDKNGNAVKSALPDITNNWTSEENKHTIEFEFSKDACYEWSVEYENKAGLSNDGVKTVSGDSPFKFTLDKTFPTGTIQIDSTNKWDKLLSVITFGIWKNDSVNFSVNASDNFGCDVSYYKSDNNEALSLETLQALYDSGKFVSEPFAIDSDEAFAIYARINDYSGNSIFISTDGIIYDTKKCQVILTPDSPNEKGLYSSDVNVKVNVTDNISGIKTVDYVVYNSSKETQRGNLYTFDKTNPSKEELLTAFEGDVSVIAEKNDSDSIRVEVTARDNAGNEFTASRDLAIDVTQPTAKISYDNNEPVFVDSNGRAYFNKDRKAVLTITDRGSAFDKTLPQVKVIARDSNGNDTEVKNVLGEWKSEKDTHSIEMAFSEDANYSIELNYENYVGYKLTEKDVKYGINEVSPFTFTVDRTDPEGKIGFGENIWDKLIETLTFDIISSSDFELTSEQSDATSPMKDMLFYKSVTSELLSKEKLDNLYENNKFSKNVPDLKVDSEKYSAFVVYARVEDFAGNYIYISTNGAIIDKAKSVVTLTRESKTDNDDWYGIGDDYVRVKATINEQSIEGNNFGFSGIKKVYYTVEANKKDGKYQKIENYTLLESETQSDNRNEQSFSISIKKSDFDFDDVRLVVFAEDFAGNISSSEMSLKIDNIAPTVNTTVTAVGKDYNFDKTVSKKHYLQSCTFKIEITEKNFNKKKAMSMITDDQTPIENILGSENIDYSQDGDKHIIEFTLDDNYEGRHKIAVDYKDQAGNKAKYSSNDTNQTKYNFIYTVVIDNTVPSAEFSTSIRNRTKPVLSMDDDNKRIYQPVKDKDYEEKTFSKLNSSLTFKKSKAISNGKLIIKVKNARDNNPIYKTYYYISNRRVPTEMESELEKFNWKEVGGNTDYLTARNKSYSEKDFKEVVKEEDGYYVVYIKVEDYAGNVHYMNSDGIILDNTQSTSTLDIVTEPVETDDNEYYDKSVNVNLSVTESKSEESEKVVKPYSGIKTVRYWIYNNNVVTEKGYIIKKGKVEKGVELKDIERGHKNVIMNIKHSVKINARNNNSDNVVLVVAAVDRANNPITIKTKRIKIDVTAPVISTNFADEVKQGASPDYYNRRTATITVTERHIDQEKSKVIVENIEGPKVSTAGEWTFAKSRTGDMNDNRWIKQIHFNNDGKYKFTVVAYDIVGHKTTSTVKEFVVDNTPPELNRISFDNNSYRNDKYYKDKRTASILVTDHNIVPSSDVTVKFQKGKSNVSWNGGGNDRFTGTIPFSNDGTYEFSVVAVDKAGNRSNEVSSNEFVIDTQSPKVDMCDDLTNGTAFGYNQNGKTPNLYFNVKDKNIESTNDKECGITFEGTARKKLNYRDFGRNTSDNKGELNFVFDDFAEKRSEDDVYHLTINATDKAGNTTKKEGEFSINRFGSSYDLSKETKEFLTGNRHHSAAETIVVKEINVNPLVKSAIEVVKDSGDEPVKLVKDKDYTVSSAKDDHFTYTYTIDKSVFADDAIYSIDISSVDKAGNTSSSKRKKVDLSFIIDSDNPIVNVVADDRDELTNDAFYAKDKLKIRIDASDNAGSIKKVEVHLDDKLIKEWSDKDLENEMSIEVSGDSSASHKLKVDVSDYAGNHTIKEIQSFKVTTDVWAQFVNNKLLFFGSILLIVAGIGLAVLLIVKKSKKSKGAENE